MTGIFQVMLGTFSTGTGFTATTGDTWIFGGYDYANSALRAYTTKISGTTFAHSEMTNASDTFSGNGGFGNDVYGFATQGSSGTIQKRTYATDTATTGTSSGANHSQGWTMFNATRGIAGLNTGASTYKYVYATDTWTSGTSLTYGSSDNYAGGVTCGTYGIYTGYSGSSSSNTKYTFATDTAAASGSSMTQTANARDQVCSTVFALRPRVGADAVDKWTFATLTESSGTAWGINRPGYGGTGIGGDKDNGIVQMGFTTLYSVYDKIYKCVLSSETWSESTALTYDRYGSAVTSTSPASLAV